MQPHRSIFHLAYMKTLTLDQGKYLAPQYTIYRLPQLLVAVTEYKTPTPTGQWHRHENCMLSYVLYGGNVESRKNQQIERTSGCVNFYHAHEPHQNIYKQFPAKHISVEICPDFLNKHQLQEGDLAKVSENNQRVGFTFTQILQELLSNNQAVAQVEMLVLELISHHLHRKPVDSHPHWLKIVREIIHDRWNEQVSLEEMALQAGVYPSSISKHFRKYFGCTLGDYTRQLKVTKAIERMQCTQESLTEISYYCGFADQSHFIKVFRQITGFNPKNFRRL